MQSMTGFGSGIVHDDRSAVTVEVRTLNHRYLDVSIRMPRPIGALEEIVKKVLSDSFVRGRVEANVTLAETCDAPVDARFNTAAIRGAWEALHETHKALGFPSQPSFEMLLHIPGLFTLESRPLDPDSVRPLLESALGSAISTVLTMRQAEGERLASDLQQRLGDITNLIDQIEARASIMLNAYRQRLASKLDEMLGQASPVDPQRLAMEVAIVAERTAIDEEIVRLKAHVAHFQQLLNAPGAVGRRLDFLVQEMHREANTIGSKQMDSRVAGHVIELKSRLEKIREQVQNVE